MKVNILLVLLFLPLLEACSSKHSDEHSKMDCSSQIHFPVTDSGIPEYPVKMMVFGIPMFATSQWSTHKLNHVSSVLAELLDQDEDGCADDQLVLKEITRVDTDVGQLVYLLPTNEQDAESGNSIMEQAGYVAAQAQWEDETIPECSGLNFTGECSDASIEELFHLITGRGHLNAYPSIFGDSWTRNSTLTEAMDVARGGRFQDIPTRYPDSAWYTYYDKTCEYGCQAIEYIWWGYCAFSGVCNGRSGTSHFEDEFKYLTKAQFVEKDSKLSKLFLESGTSYTLPTKYVDGIYHGCKTCSDGPNHGGN